MRARKLSGQELWEYALKVVGARARSSGEIRAKLAGRAADGAEIDPVMNRMKEYGMIDDRRFAQAFATSRLENRGQGKQRTLLDLRRRRVAPQLAEHAVANAYAGSDETALIQEFIRRKYRNADREKLFAEEKDLAAAVRRLRMAGFQTGNIIRVLKSFAANPELLDGVEK